MNRIIIIIAIAVLIPSVLLAQTSDPPTEPPAEPTPTPAPAQTPPEEAPDPEEAGLPENCTWPGIVINSTSNKEILIWWDTDEEPYQWKDAVLQPGQNSTMHTCDADYYTYQYANWYHSLTLKLAGHRSPYIYHSTYECVDHPRIHNTVQCNWLGWNFNPGADD